MIKEKRPFPVPSEVVMRSALFALANLKTTLQVYNEETGVIVATISKRLGMQKQEVVVKVRRFEKTSILDIEAPDPKLAQQLLAQISNYVTDGAGRVQADATIQWVDVARQRESSARRRQLINKARAILPGQSSDETLPAVIDSQGIDETIPTVIDAQESDETLPTVIDSQGSEIVPAADDNGSAPMPIPDNPGVLVKNYQDKVIELKVDPAVFIDRTPYLEVCQACSATVMRGSKYCSSCGRPLTLEAVQPELQNAAGKAARASLQTGLVAVAATLVPFLLLIVPLLFETDVTLSFLEKVGQSMTPVRLALSVLLGVLPALIFGWWAVSQARQAAWYQNLEAMFDEPGRLKASLGRVLGWSAVYISVAWILFVLVALLFK